jgi:hypothetical protein
MTVEKIGSTEHYYIQHPALSFYLWRWDYRKGQHDSVGVLLTDLGDEESAHP